MALTELSPHPLSFDNHHFNLLTILFIMYKISARAIYHVFIYFLFFVSFLNEIIFTIILNNKRYAWEPNSNHGESMVQGVEIKTKWSFLFLASSTDKFNLIVSLIWIVKLFCFFFLISYNLFIDIRLKIFINII